MRGINIVKWQFPFAHARTLACSQRCWGQVHRSHPNRIESYYCRTSRESSDGLAPAVNTPANSYSVSACQPGRRHTEFLPSLPPVTSFIPQLEPSTASGRSVEEKQLYLPLVSHLSIPHAPPKLLRPIDTRPFHAMHRIINSCAALTSTGHIAGLLCFAFGLIGD